LTAVSARARTSARKRPGEARNRRSRCPEASPRPSVLARRRQRVRKLWPPKIKLSQPAVETRNARRGRGAWCVSYSSRRSFAGSRPPWGSPPSYRTQAEPEPSPFAPRRKRGHRARYFPKAAGSARDIHGT
jgi:hypothetical protein